MMETKSEKLTFWQKLGYGMGDFYGGGAGTLISFFYLVFLTDVVRISPGLAGTVILISKIYDSVTDPFEGVISDRTRTKLGRRRPYLLAGIPLVFLSFFAMFYPVSFESETSRFLFVIATYLFFSTIVSIVMLNYSALQAELTLDYNERTSLATFRIFFSTISSILCALLPLEIVKAFPDVHTGWIVTAIAFGLLFALPSRANARSFKKNSALSTGNKLLSNLSRCVLLFMY
jgi:oligogalacturonide transporter